MQYRIELETGSV